MLLGDVPLKILHGYMSMGGVGDGYGNGDDVGKRPKRQTRKNLTPSTPILKAEYLPSKITDALFYLSKGLFAAQGCFKFSIVGSEDHTTRILYA